MWIWHRLQLSERLFKATGRPFVCWIAILQISSMPDLQHALLQADGQQHALVSLPKSCIGSQNDTIADLLAARFWRHEEHPDFQSCPNLGQEHRKREWNGME